MDPLTIEKIIEIHDYEIETDGGTSGILAIATLDFLVYRANQEENIFKKAAIVLYCICSNHPFIDGNKRTAFLAAENILGQNDYYIDSESKIIEFMLEVAQYHHSIKSIEKWIEANSLKEL